MTGEQLVHVPVAQIVAGDNDRLRFRETELSQLASSIAELGLLQPPTLRPIEGGFEIVAGERRVRAVQRLGWETIPALVRDLDDATASQLMLAENTARIGLDPIEEARAYRKRLAQGWTRQQLAESVGVSPGIIERRCALLDLCPEVQELVSCGTLILELANQMRGLDPNRQILASQAILSGSLDRDGTRMLCDRLRREQSEEPMFDAASFLVAELVEDATARRRVSRKDLVALVARILEVDDLDELRQHAARVLAREPRYAAA